VNRRGKTLEDIERGLKRTPVYLSQMNREKNDLVTNEVVRSPLI
jgi:hypothetical protein